MSVQITVITDVVLYSDTMPTSTNISWDSLEQWSETLFLVSGGLFLINAVHEVIGRYTGYLEVEFLNAVIYLSALVISLVGLLGFYRQLSERTPRLARASAGVAVVAGTGLIVLLVWASITAVLNQPMPPGILLIVALAGMVLGFLLFTVASLRTHIPSRTVSRLLLGFVLAWVVALAGGFVAFGLDAPDWFAPSLNVVSSVFLLTIGYALRTGTGPSDRADPGGDPTAK